MIITRGVIVAELRRRGQAERADFVERQLPAEVDSGRHASLLGMLRINTDEILAAARPAENE